MKKRFWSDNRGISGFPILVFLTIVAVVVIAVMYKVNKDMYHTYLSLPEPVKDTIKSDMPYVVAGSIVLIIIAALIGWRYERIQARKREERYRRDRELREAQRQASREAFDEATVSFSPEQKTLLYGRLRSQNANFIGKERQPISEFCKGHGLPVNFETLGRVHYSVGRLEVQGRFYHLDLFGEDTEWFRQGKDYFQKRYEEEFEAITQNISEEQKAGLKERIAGFSEPYRCWSHIAYVWWHCLEKGLPIKEEDERKLVRLYAQSLGYTGEVGVL